MPRGQQAIAAASEFISDPRNLRAQPLAATPQEELGVLETGLPRERCRSPGLANAKISAGMPAPVLAPDTGPRRKASPQPCWPAELGLAERRRHLVPCAPAQHLPGDQPKISLPFSQLGARANQPGSCSAMPGALGQCHCEFGHTHWQTPNPTGLAALRHETPPVPRPCLAPSAAPWDTWLGKMPVPTVSP